MADQRDHSQFFSKESNCQGKSSYFKCHLSSKKALHIFELLPRIVVAGLDGNNIRRVSLMIQDLFTVAAVFGVCGIMMAHRDNNSKFKEILAGLYEVSPDEDRLQGLPF